MKTTHPIATLLVSASAAIVCFGSGVLWAQDEKPDTEIPEDAVVADPVPPRVDPTPIDNVPPPIPVSDPAAKLRVVHLDNPDAASVDMLSAIESASNLVMFGKLVKAAGAEILFTQGGPMTVFAPTDDAFAKLPAATQRALLLDEASANKLLQRHIVNDVLVAKDIESGDIETAAGTDLAVKKSAEGTGIAVAGSRVVGSDLITRNGVLHTVDNVLVLLSE